MRRKIAIAGLVIFAIGLLLLFINLQISGMVMQDIINDAKPESIAEVFGIMVTAGAIASNIYRLISIIAIFLIICGLIILCVGYFMKEKKVKSFKKRKPVGKAKAKYSRTEKVSKRAKAKSFIVTGWSKKSKKPKGLKLKKTRKNKKFQAWGKRI